MAGRVVRSDSAVLAVLAVLAMAAGGALVGGGAAGAQSADFGSTQGDSSCPPFTDQDGPVGGIGNFCDDYRWQKYAQVGDFQAGLTGRDSVQPGENAVVRTSFKVSEAGLRVASATVRTPKGYEFTGGTVSLNRTAAPATFTVDPETGDVTVTTAGDGWEVPVTAMHNGLGEPNGMFAGWVEMELTYRTSGLIPLGVGETALRFSGTGVPDSGWVVKGITTISPVPSGISLGSSSGGFGA
ncbi:hypothetical protein [Rhodococcus sp. NPDC003348]